jgi:hypothetical protein
MLDATSSGSSFIWVANTGEGSVSKVDISTYEELGRYRVGRDPSRTSVNTLGDVYVGNRGGRSLTKISGRGEGCPDTDGDGVVTTSGGSDMLPFGRDDCVLWTTELPDCDIIRAVAAQDDLGPDGDIHSYVWAGGWGGCLWKLDGETGEIVIDATESPVLPYGFALDGRGNLWIATLGNELGRVNTRACIDDISCALPFCSEEEECVKQRIIAPVWGYGITVDGQQRVWLGGGFARYDPAAPLGDRWIEVGGPAVNGVAADGRGWIWGGGMERIVRVDADNPRRWVVVPGAGGFSSRGVAVDSEGKIWGINMYHNNATVIRPGADLRDSEVETNVAPYFVRPYTYSDMTGTQLRIATMSHGFYREVIRTCNTEPPYWTELEFDAVVPQGTHLLFRVRTADAAEGLDGAPWVVVGRVPDDESPLSVAEAFEARTLEERPFLEVEIQLSRDQDLETLASPVVLEMEVIQACRVY